MIFDYLGQIDLKEIKKVTKLRKLRILDFGCGIGIWSRKDLKQSFVQKITLYDKNNKLQKKLNEKYIEKKINVVFDLRKILQKNDFNLVIISSVVQYMNIFKLKKIIHKISKNFYRKNHKLYIIITDIPKFSRVVEFILLPFFNINRFFCSIKYFTNKDYKKLTYYRHEEKDFFFLKKNFYIKKSKNLRGLKFLRYSLILKLKKKN